MIGRRGTAGLGGRQALKRNHLDRIQGLIGPVGIVAQVDTPDLRSYRTEAFLVGFPSAGPAGRLLSDPRVLYGRPRRCDQRALA